MKFVITLAANIAAKIDIKKLAVNINKYNPRHAGKCLLNMFFKLIKKALNGFFVLKNTAGKYSISRK